MSTSNRILTPSHLGAYDLRLVLVAKLVLFLVTTEKFVCDLCGRYRERNPVWFRGQASDETVIIRADRTGVDDSACHICDERCAADYVAIWVHERELRARQQHAASKHQ